MNYNDSLKLLTSQEKFHIDLGLDRMRNIAQLFSNPQDKLKIIHIAGTNGKGSTCAMLSALCEKKGLKTGLFTSPHIKSYTERIMVNQNNISESDFAKYIELVEDKAKKNNIPLTEFEILTMMAFLYFYDEKIDIVILETGMGGRLDATNIINNPILTIITSVSLDHTDRLGSTIEKISLEKAGILKKNTPLIISEKNLGYSTIKKQADKMSIKILPAIKDFELINKEKNIFSNGEIDIPISLRGINQGQNLALVYEVSKYLNLDIENSLVNVVWNSRMQYIKEKNLLVDAAHNPDAINLLNKNIDTYFSNQNRAFLFGVLNTKDYKIIIKNLFRESDEIFVTDNFAYNAVSKEVLASEIKKEFPDIKLKLININNIDEFINYNFNGIKICCGSFYICSKVL